MRKCAAAAAYLLAVLSAASTAGAQSWTGLYVGGTVGAGLQKDDPSETVTFDTNLDGTFADTIRTAAGADAFSPGFCGGLAVGPAAAGGCTEDEDGLDLGGRLGYDRRFGRVVAGGLVDVSSAEISDSVTAFSSTPAFYSFTREPEYIVGLRGRIGVGNDRVLVYGTGGGAWSRVEQVFTTSNAVNTFTRTGSADRGDDEPSASVWGYQAGGGVELMLGARWSLAGEYLFTSLDDREDATIRVQGPAPATNPFILVNAAGTNLQRTDTFEFQTARIGLNLRF